MNSHFGTKRVSTRKSCTETSQLLAFLNTVIDSDTCKSLSHALDSCNSNIQPQEGQPKENSCLSDFIEGFKSDIENGNIKNLENLKTQLLSFFKDTVIMNFPYKDLEILSKELTEMIEKTMIEYNEKNEFKREKTNGKQNKEDSIKNSKSSSKKKTISKGKNKKSQNVQKDIISKIRKKPQLSCPFIEAETQQAKEIEAKAALFCDLSSLSKENTLKFLEYLQQNSSELIKEESQKIEPENENTEKKTFNYIISMDTLENITKICEYFKSFKQNVLQEKDKSKKN